MMGRRCVTVVILCLSLWLLCYVCLGYTTAGKNWYARIASPFFVEGAGPIVMNLAIPILLSGTIATMFMFQKLPTGGNVLPHLLPSWIHRFYHRWRTSVGDMNLKRFIVYFIFWPLVLMCIGNIFRHLHGKELSLDAQLMEIGNTFGFIALIAMSYFLIPVARQSPILKLFELSPTAAVQIHIWSGRIIVLGVVLHGSFHVYRWLGLAGENIVAMIIPPTQCFTLSEESDFVPACVDKDTDCKCYDLLRNLTGILALVGLLIIGLTSLNYVRRTNYRLFYLTHVMVAPTVLLVVILHYDKAMIYLSPSILYYIASSFPVMTENQACCCSGEVIKPTRVERIKSTVDRRQRECISLTVKATSAAVDMLCSGQYIKLGAPQLSLIKHPFTVNRVHGSKEELRIIFRVMGKFTNQLCDRLVNPVNDFLPTLTIDGFHGPQNRLDQVLRHDVAVLVAGGIGITPYLSLLEDVLNALVTTENCVTKKVVLHWICREQVLIDYVVKEYFEPIMATSQSFGFTIDIIVHKTSSPYNDVDNADNEELPREGRPVHSRGDAFCPTLYSAGGSCSQIHVLIATLSFSTISWVGLWTVMALYHRNNAEEEILYRIYSPISVILIGLGVSWLAKCLFPLQQRRDTMLMRLHEGVVFTRVDDGSTDIEEVMGHHDDQNNGDDGLAGVHEPKSLAVTLEQREGARPTVHCLLKALDSARCPGLFMCGPVSLMNDLRSAAVERCSIRRCQCISGDPNIAVYEEHFEI